MVLVSVIIPTTRRPDLVLRALQSVFTQTHSNLEAIVVVDGPNPETLAVLSAMIEPRLRVMHNPASLGPGVARNLGAAAAHGIWLAFLDDDDEWLPEKLERQLAALRERPRCRWSYTACRHIDESGRLIPKKRPAPPAPEGWIFRQLLTLEIGIAMPTVIVERSLFEEVGGFDEQQLFGEFHDLCLRLALGGEVVVVREHLCAVRVHHEHYSSDRTANHAGWLRLYRKMAGMTDDSGLRAYCARMQADESLNLVRAHASKREYRLAWTTLVYAMTFSWRYPHWWWAAVRGVIRSLIPNAVAAALQPRRSSK